mgnify:CR=1 FL=1
MYTRVLNLVDLLASDTQVILRRVLLRGTQVLLETEYHLSISRKTLSGYTGAGEALSSTGVLGRVPIIVYGSYGPTPASKTTHFFALLISRPSSCVHRESVKNSFDDFEIYRIFFWFNKKWSAKFACACFLRKAEESIDPS